MDAASDGNPADRAAAKEAVLGEILLTRGTPGEDRNPFRETVLVRDPATMAAAHAVFDDPAYALVRTALKACEAAIPGTPRFILKTIGFCVDGLGHGIALYDAVTDPAATPDAQLLAVVEAGAHLAKDVGHFGAAAGYDGLAGGAKTVSLPIKARATEMRGKPASDAFVAARLSNEAPLYGVANAAMNATIRALSEKPEDRDVVLRKLR
ncbi:MAG: hypothetical protein AAGC92_13110 [Pseudomonadota bacterium]